MLKYLYTQIYTKEIPDEISLGISITGCPIHCNDCHSSHTWDKDLGTDLTIEELIRLITTQKYVTCILFYGGEWEIEHLISLCTYLKNLEFKVALYSGHNLEFIQKYDTLLSLLDYIKVGKYDVSLGSLEYPSTNQRLYSLKNGKIEKDLTSVFWRTGIRND